MAILNLSDGRKLEYEANENAGDAAILLHHGTPGCAIAWREWISATDDVRIIAASRPGYGASTRSAGRTVSSDLADQAELLDSLGIERFVSIGWSGGGPHALGMSSDPRCAGVITLAGVGEWGHTDLDFLAGMGPENEIEFGAALAGEQALTSWMNSEGLGMAQVSGENLIEALGGLIGEADKATLTLEYADATAAAFRHGLSQGFAGWIDDDLAFVQPWGFGLGEITKPVKIWQGDDDFMVPKAHGVWLAEKIRTSQLNFVPNHGHISLVRDYRGQIIEAALEFLAK